MDNAITIVAAFLLIAPVCGQERELEEQGQSASTISRPITKEQVLELPRRDKAPSLSMKQALSIAENFIRKERLDISSCYLFEAKLAVGNTEETEPTWNFWWVRTQKGNGKDMRIAVSMEGIAKLLGDL